MRYRALHVHAFKRIKNPFLLPLDGQGLCLVEGENRDRTSLSPSNGAGKSLALVETLVWAQFGKMVRHEDASVTDEATHPERGAHTTLEIEREGREFRQTRRRPPKGTAKVSLEIKDTAGVWASYKGLSRDHQRAASNLEELLRMDYAVCRHAVVIGREALAGDGFATQMALIESLLRLDELSEASEEGRRRATQMERNSAATRAELTAAEQGVTQAEQLLAELEAMEQAARQRREGEAKRLTQQLEAARVAVLLVPKLRQVVEDTERTMDRARNEASVSNGIITPLLREREQEQKKVKALICETCKRPFGSPEALKKAQDKAAKAVEKLTTQIDAHYKAKGKADQEQATASVRLHSQRQELQRAEQQAAQVPTLEQQAVSLQTQEQETVSRRTTLEGHLKQAQQALTAKQAELPALLTALARLQRGVRAFGRDGLQARIFASATPELNRAAAYYSQRLFGGDPSVVFNPLRGSQRESLITIAGQTAAPTYRGCSAGEKERINLITAFSLRALARWRAGEPINLSIFDESFDGLDDGGLEAVAKLLAEEVTQSKGTTFVITHNPHLKAFFPGAKLLRVVREGGEATVTFNG